MLGWGSYKAVCPLCLRGFNWTTPKGKVVNARAGQRQSLRGNRVRAVMCILGDVPIEEEKSQVPPPLLCPAWSPRAPWWGACSCLTAAPVQRSVTTSFTAHAALLPPLLRRRRVPSAAGTGGTTLAPRGTPPTGHHLTPPRSTPHRLTRRGQVRCPRPPRENLWQRRIAHTAQRASWKQGPRFPCAKARHSQSSTFPLRYPCGILRRGEPGVQLGLCAAHRSVLTVRSIATEPFIGRYQNLMFAGTVTAAAFRARGKPEGARRRQREEVAWPRPPRSCQLRCHSPQDMGMAALEHQDKSHECCSKPQYHLGCLGCRNPWDEGGEKGRCPL